MSTLIHDATSAVIAALQATPAVADQVQRARLRPLAAGQSTMVVVRPVQADVLDDELAGPVVSWDVLIAVECYARASASTAPDTAVDAVLEAVHARLASDPTLGGAVIALQPKKVSFDIDADGEQTVCAVSLFNARQRTAGAHL